MYTYFWWCWNRITHTSWIALNQQSYVEVQAQVLQYSFNQLCTGTASATLLLSDFFSLLTSEFGSYEVWVFSIYPTTMVPVTRCRSVFEGYVWQGGEVIYYAVYLVIMITAFTPHRPNKSFKVSPVLRFPTECDCYSTGHDEYTRV